MTFKAYKKPVEIEALTYDGTNLQEIADFVGYLRIYRDLPEFESILKDPTNAIVPERPDVMYALCSMLAHNTSDNNASSMVTYIRRFPSKEFAAFFMRDTLQRKPELKKNKDIISWVMNEGKELLL